MAEQETWQLGGNAAQVYEEQKVPSLFRPLAELTLQHVDVHEGDRVIDLACGTGILGRLAAEKAGRSGSVVGVDLNAGIIEEAKRHPPTSGAGLELIQGDVTALDYPDASFDVAFCQQGLQFFPNKLAALKEIRRVLTPGGTVALTVWSSLPPWGIAIADGLTRYVSADVAQRSLGPFSFRDPDVIRGLLVEAGFSKIYMEILEVKRSIGPAEVSIPEDMASTAYAADVAKLDIATRAAMVKEIGEALGRYRVDGGLAVPQETLLIRAAA